MSEICRPLGRLFLCAGLFVAMVATGYGEAPSTTTVSDVIYRADGTPARGTLLISWPAFISGDNRAISAGSMSIPVGEDGVVAVALIPNEGATPAGTYYTVVLKLEGGTTEKEYWTVPTSSPVSIADIRSVVVPQSVAVQMVSKQYVDSQIASKANDNAVVHSTGEENIGGVKEFALSPRVPAPESGTDAANKDYVDAAVGLVGEGSYVKKSGDAMTGPLVLWGDPESSNQATTRHYVDTEVAGVAGALATKESINNKDQANGYAGLDGSGYVGNAHLGAGTADSSKCLKGDHSWATCGGGDSTTIRYVTSEYNWSVAPTTPSALVAGVNTVTITPCPKGVDPTTTSNYYVYLSGTGTAEAALVTGGTACSSNSLTLTFTASGAHSSGYTVGSASGGIREASNDARIRPTNPTGSWQSGKVIVPPGEYKAYAPIYIQATNQTVDFSGSIIECYDGTKPCLFVGSPTSSNSYQNMTLINPKARPMVSGGTNAFIEVNANATHVIKPLTRAPLTGNSFGYLVQVDDDQAFELEGLDPSSGDALRCDATFCGAAVYAPGPFAGNAAVGWIHHSNMTLNCKSNGIEWQSGNTLKISDSVIQGYPQFAIRGGKRGGYGGIVFDNVYTEVGNCTNPLGNVGFAGAIIQGHAFKFVNDTVSAPAGSFPQFANTGSTNYHYWIVAHHATYGDSIPLAAGYAKTDGTTAVPVSWFKIAGADRFKVLRMTWDGQPFTRPFPHDTGNYLVGTVLASSCAGPLCTFSDAHGTPRSYTSVSATGLGNWYYPLIDFWPGNVIMSASGDSDSVADTGVVYADSIPGSVVAVNNPSLASLFVQDCNPATAHADAWGPVSLIRKSCQHVQGSQNAYQLGGVFLGNKVSSDGGQQTQIKGRMNFGNFGYGPVDIVTWYDTALGKTLSDPYNRPSNDAEDAATGMEDRYTLYDRAATAIRSYIGKAADGSPQEELTASQKRLNVPLVFKEQAVPPNPGSGMQIVYAKSGGFCAKDSAGNEKCMGASGEGGVTVFTGLADVPNSYVSQRYKLVRVNGGETALEFLGVPDCSNEMTSKLLYNASTGVWWCGTDQSSGGGATTFTSLTDVPNSYGGAGGKIVRVNTGATGLEFIGIPDCSNPTTSKLLYDASTSTWSCGTDQNSTGNYVALTPAATQVLQGIGGSYVPFVVRGSATGQISNLQEWQDKDGNVLASVGPGGAVSIPGPGTYADDALHLGSGISAYAELGLEGTASNSIRFKRVTNDFQMSNVGGNFNFYRWNGGTTAYEEVFHMERSSNDVYLQGRLAMGAHEISGISMGAPSNPGGTNFVLWVDSTTHKLSCKYSAGSDCMPAGSGGGGDADTVDGQHASAFASADHTHTPPGSDTQVFFNDAGTWGSSGDLIFNKSTKTLAIGGNQFDVHGKEGTPLVSAADECRLSFSISDRMAISCKGGTASDLPLFADLSWANLLDKPSTFSPPALGISSLGGVKGTGTSLTCTSGQVADGFNPDGSLHCVAGGGSGGPPGSDRQVAFNDGSVWGASADLTFDKTTGALSSKGHNFTGTGPLAIESTPGTCGVAGTGKFKVCFSNTNNRFAGSYNGGSYSDFLQASDRGIANGIATLDSNVKIPAAQMPDPTTSTLGGIKAKTCTGTDKISAIGTDGMPVCGADQGVAGAYVLFGGTGGAATVAKATSYYSGMDVSQPFETVAAGVYDRESIVIPKDGTIQRVDVKSQCSTAASSSEDTTFYVRLNDSSDVLVNTVKWNVSTWQNIGNASLDQAVSAGDTVVLKVVTPDWSGSAADTCRVYFNVTVGMQ